VRNAHEVVSAAEASGFRSDLTVCNHQGGGYIRCSLLFFLFLIANAADSPSIQTSPPYRCAASVQRLSTTRT